MHVVVLYVLPLLLSVEAITDLTITEWAYGRDVVEGVVQTIHEKCIFENDGLLLRRWAGGVSECGQNFDTFRSAFYGGIWQISEKQYNSTKYASLEHLTAIKKEFSIDWVATKWKDLLKPLYSGLAARLLLTLLVKKLPKTTKEENKILSTITGYREEYYLFWFTMGDMPCGEKTEIKSNGTTSIRVGTVAHFTYEATTNCQTLTMGDSFASSWVYFGSGYQPNPAKFDYVTDLIDVEIRLVTAVFKKPGKIFITVNSLEDFDWELNSYQNKCECPKGEISRYVNEQLTICKPVLPTDTYDRVYASTETFYIWTNPIDKCQIITFHIDHLFYESFRGIIYYASNYHPTKDKYDYMVELRRGDWDAKKGQFRSVVAGKIFLTIVSHNEIDIFFAEIGNECDCGDRISRPIDSNFISCRFSHDLKNQTHAETVGMEKYYHYQNTANCTKLQISRRGGRAMVYYGSNYPPNATKYDALTVLNDDMVGVVVMKMTGKIYLNIINEELGLVGFHTSPGECSCPEGQSSWKGEMFDVCGSGPTGSSGTLVAILLSLALLIIIIVIIIICMRRRKNEERQATEVKLPDKCPSFCCFLVCCRRSAEKEDGRDKQ